jgi:hypothetical protein
MRVCAWAQDAAHKAADKRVEKSQKRKFISQPIDVSLIVPDRACLRCGGIITSGAGPALCLVTVAAECVQ